MKKRKSEIIIFNGITYYRYPESTRRSDRVYFKAKDYLHRDVWKAINGQIPSGFEIHHKDEDTSNNDISNLECVERSSHRRQHSSTPERLAHLIKIQPAAVAVSHANRTKESYSLGVQNGWKVRKAEFPHTCLRCGNVYLSFKKKSINPHCSEACRIATRRKSGTDETPGVCDYCKKGFMCKNKYKPTKFCSLSCAAKSSKNWTKKAK